MMPKVALTVDVDLEAHPHDVVLRFYDTSLPARRLLGMQALFNVANRCRRNLAEPATAADRRIIDTVWPRISKPFILRQNLDVLKVPRPEWTRWLDAWREIPEKVLEHQSQAPVHAGPTTARITFQLEPHDERNCLLSAFVVAGTIRKPYHEVRSGIVEETGQIRLPGMLCNLEFPFDRDMLDRVFAQQQPIIPSRPIPKHLPTILRHRIDLLSGSSVDVERVPGQAVVRVDMDAARLRLDIRVGRAPVFADPAIPCATLRRKDQATPEDPFLVTIYTSPALAEIRRLIAESPLDVQSPGVYLCKGEALQVAEIRDRLRALPEDVTVHWSPAAKALGNAAPAVEAEIAVEPGRGWFAVDVTIRVGGEVLSPHDVDKLLLESQNTIMGRSGNWVTVPLASLRALRQRLADGGLVPGEQRLPTVTARQALKAIDWSHFTPQRRSGPTIAQLRNQADAPPLEIAAELDQRLREYQREGARFLHNRAHYEVGCLLADDMGLGKTLQTLAWLGTVHPGKAPSLVVCPASVVSVWLQEAAAFAPGLRVAALTGPADQRRERASEPSATDLFVTTYATVRNDVAMLRRIRFRALILDEAQQIKNPDAQVTGAVKSLQAAQRVAITGTPLENRLLDLWSITDFLNPGLLGSQELVAGADAATARRVSDRIAPITIRRTKEQVAPELPPRTEETLLLPMTPFQHQVYEMELLRAREQASDGNVARILAALTRLRQVCCHPELLPDEGRGWIRNAGDVPSAKLTCLLEQLEQLLAEGHSALVFSQFTAMLTLIENRLEHLGMPRFKITGDTPPAKRPDIVSQFADSADPAVFLLSLKAAGTGLTLTKADYVFIFDPWWNPAAEQQAIDRTHRIGQEKPVIAYRLAMENSVESRVLAMQEEKRRLFAEVVDGASPAAATLSAADLAALLG